MRTREKIAEGKRRLKQIWKEGEILHQFLDRKLDTLENGNYSDDLEALFLGDSMIVGDIPKDSEQLSKVKDALEIYLKGLLKNRKTVECRDCDNKSINAVCIKCQERIRKEE